MRLGVVGNGMIVDWLFRDIKELPEVRAEALCCLLYTSVGGGIRTVEDFRRLLREGADKISINSSAINTPNLISDAAEKFGRQCVVVAIDARRRPDGSGWNVFKNGGRIDTGLDAVEWAMKADRLGAGEILLTSMDLSLIHISSKSFFCLVRSAP